MLANMTMSEGLRKILDIIADGTGRNLSKSIPDTDVIEHSGLPSEEVYSYLNQLEGLGFISIGIKWDHRLVNITKDGLEKNSSNEDLRQLRGGKYANQGLFIQSLTHPDCGRK